MRHVKQYVCVIIAFVLLFTLFSGCARNAESVSGQPARYSSFRDIPGVTDDDIKNIEELQLRYTTFVFANDQTTEAFFDRNGEIQGFLSLFCGWLTEMFGIEFTPAIVDWGGLVAGLENGTIDFTGDLTATEERRQNGYIMTEAIAERMIKMIRIEGSLSISDISSIRLPRYIFPEGSTTYEMVANALEPGTYEALFAADYEAGYVMLKNGEGDALLEANIAEDAVLCVAKGTGLSLKYMDHFEKNSVNKGYFNK